MGGSEGYQEGEEEQAEGPVTTPSPPATPSSPLGGDGGGQGTPEIAQEMSTHDPTRVFVLTESGNVLPKTPGGAGLSGGRQSYYAGERVQEIKPYVARDDSQLFSEVRTERGTYLLGESKEYSGRVSIMFPSPTGYRVGQVSRQFQDVPRDTVFNDERGGRITREEAFGRLVAGKTVTVDRRENVSNISRWFYGLPKDISFSVGDVVVSRERAFEAALEGREINAERPREVGFTTQSSGGREVGFTIEEGGDASRSADLIRWEEVPYKPMKIEVDMSKIGMLPQGVKTVEGSVSSPILSLDDSVGYPRISRDEPGIAERVWRRIGINPEMDLMKYEERKGLENDLPYQLAKTAVISYAVGYSSGVPLGKLAYTAPRVARTAMLGLGGVAIPGIIMEAGALINEPNKEGVLRFGVGLLAGVKGFQRGAGPALPVLLGWEKQKSTLRAAGRGEDVEFFEAVVRRDWPRIKPVRPASYASTERFQAYPELAADVEALSRSGDVMTGGSLAGSAYGVNRRPGDVDAFTPARLKGLLPLYETVTSKYGASASIGGEGMSKTLYVNLPGGEKALELHQMGWRQAFPYLSQEEEAKGAGAIMGFAEQLKRKATGAILGGREKDMPDLLEMIEIAQRAEGRGGVLSAADSERLSVLLRRPSGEASSLAEAYQIGYPETLYPKYAPTFNVNVGGDTYKRMLKDGYAKPVEYRPLLNQTAYPNGDRAPVSDGYAQPDAYAPLVQSAPYKIPEHTKYTPPAGKPIGGYPSGSPMIISGGYQPPEKPYAPTPRYKPPSVYTPLVTGYTPPDRPPKVPPKEPKQPPPKIPTIGLGGKTKKKTAKGYSVKFKTKAGGTQADTQVFASPEEAARYAGYLVDISSLTGFKVEKTDRPVRATGLSPRVQGFSGRAHKFTQEGGYTMEKKKHRTDSTGERMKGTVKMIGGAGVKLGLGKPIVQLSKGFGKKRHGGR